MGTKKSSKNYALINCNIIDGNLDSEIIHNGIILIENITKNGDEIEYRKNGIIKDIGSKNSIEIPDNYKIIDLHNQYVLPGLINAHCHLMGNGKPLKMMNISDNMQKLGLKLLNNPIGKKFFLNLMKKNVTNALNAGVTTLRSLGDPFYIDLKLRNLIDTGKYLGPRLLVAGKGICITGGHGAVMGFVADSRVEVRKAIRKNLREGVDCIKILSTGGVMDAKKVGEAGRPQMTIEEIETACFEAHRGGLLVATHCESTAGIKEALTGGVDTIEHGAEIIDDLIPLFKNNPKSLRGYTTLVPTISAGMGLSVLPITETKITSIKKENGILIEKGMIVGLQRAYREKLKIGMGTDASVPFVPHYEFWKELKYFIKYTGMISQEAIHYATKGNAEIIGIGNETGSLETGKSADLIAVKGNPVENIDTLNNVTMVMVRGNLIQKPKVKKIKQLHEFEPLEV